MAGLELCSRRSEASTPVLEPFCTLDAKERLPPFKGGRGLYKKSENKCCTTSFFAKRLFSPKSGEGLQTIFGKKKERVATKSSCARVNKNIPSSL